MPSRMQLCSQCGFKCRATLNMCPTCYPPHGKISLHAELLDAWEGEGNSSRISFRDWLRDMANNPRGTLQDAAKRYRKGER